MIVLISWFHLLMLMSFTEIHLVQIILVLFLIKQILLIFMGLLILQSVVTIRQNYLIYLVRPLLPSSFLILSTPPNMN